MLIAISGSQGSGKSFLLSRIKELGFNVVERKTSRSILADWDVTLEQVNNDNDLTLRFQEEILRRKFQDEMIGCQDDIWFTERTYADLMTYFLITLGKTNKYSKNINEYYHHCIHHQQSYDKVFYLKAGHFVPEKDGIRGDNVHYSRMADIVMLDFTIQMTPIQKLNVIDTPCLEQRLSIILAHCGVIK